MFISCCLRLLSEGFPLGVNLAAEFSGMKLSEGIVLFSMQDTFRVSGTLRRDIVRGGTGTAQGNFFLNVFYNMEMKYLYHLSQCNNIMCAFS